MQLQSLATLAVLGLASAHATAAIRITEFMYSGNNGEFIELTNTGPAAVNFAGWKFSDSARAVDVTGPTLNTAGTVSTTTTPFDLSGFGTVQPGQSVVLTEAVAADFRAAWSLPSNIVVLGSLGASVDVGGGGVAGNPTIRNANGFNLGNGDEINLYDAANTLIDRLTYGTTPRTQFISASTTPANYGTNTIAGWTLSAAGDGLGSRSSTGGDLANPGTAAVPEPASVALLGLGAVAVLRRRRV